MQGTDTRQCLNCKKSLNGRADKKFCNDQCRNDYNNKLRSTPNNYVRNINNALGKNRKILESLLPKGQENCKIKKENLTREGFNFKYHTHSYINQKGNVYIFCYDFGYLPLENDWFLLVKRRKNEPQNN